MHAFSLLQRAGQHIAHQRFVGKILLPVHDKHKVRSALQFCDNWVLAGNRAGVGKAVGNRIISGVYHKPLGLAQVSSSLLAGGKV